jgi:hypothetical protein
MRFDSKIRTGALSLNHAQVRVLRAVPPDPLGSVGRADALRVSIERPLGELETERLRAHILGMTKPEFHPKLNRSGTWFVAVVTGHGPESHIGDFPTEEEAQRWIATKSKYWPGKPDAPGTQPTP